MNPAEGDDDLEQLEISLLLDAIAHRYGYDFRGYSPASLRRRIRRVLDHEGVASPSALQDRVLRDPRALARLVNRLSIHVTTMFRDPPFYTALRDRIVPLLRTWPFVRIWVAGCATGEEAYSLAILLHEANLYARCRIYATDLAPDLVLRARRGIYPIEALDGFEANYRASGGTGALRDWFRIDHRYAVVRDAPRSNLVFAQHNLVSDGSFNEFHLVLCRNVLI
ncbi:MAG: CheR family methyltransferase, partial [Myxococcota bacterium]